MLVIHRAHKVSRQFALHVLSGLYRQYSGRGLRCLMQGRKNDKKSAGRKSQGHCLRARKGIPCLRKNSFACFTYLMYEMSDEERVYEMIKVSASEFQRSLGSISDNALREAVTITKQGRNHLVLLSYDEYARLKRRDRTVGLAGELSDEWLDAVRRAEAPTDAAGP